MNLYQQYQQSLPVYQYNDLILPGVTIQNVDVSQLVTLFTDFYVDLDAVTGHQSQQQQEEQTQSRVRAHLKRLDHQPYQYKIAVHSEQNVPGAVVRVFLGPKHDHQADQLVFLRINISLLNLINLSRTSMLVKIPLLEILNKLLDRARIGRLLLKFNEESMLLSDPRNHSTSLSHIKSSVSLLDCLFPKVSHKVSLFNS